MTTGMSAGPGRSDGGESPWVEFQLEWRCHVEQLVVEGNNPAPARFSCSSVQPLCRSETLRRIGERASEWPRLKSESPGL